MPNEVQTFLDIIEPDLTRTTLDGLVVWTSEAGQFEQSNGALVLVSGGVIP